MRKPIIGVDVDETVADLLGEWLRRYNRAYDDSLLPEDLTEWELEKQVKPECGHKIFDILREQDMYDHVLPLPGARTGVHQLVSAGYRVVYVTSCVEGTADQKLRWLRRWKFLPDIGGRVCHDFIACSDKALIDVDILFDDNVVTVERFPRKAFLITQPHNIRIATKRIRVRGMIGALEWVQNG